MEVAIYSYTIPEVMSKVLQSIGIGKTMFKKTSDSNSAHCQTREQVIQSHIQSHLCVIQVKFARMPTSEQSSSLIVTKTAKRIKLTYIPQSVHSTR